MELVEVDAEGVNTITAWHIKNAWCYELNKPPPYPISILNKPSAFVKTPVILVMHNHIEIFRNKLFIQQTSSRQKILDLLQTISL